MIIGLMSQYFFGLAICISSLFLVLLVLVQRGRGGGLTGALGGPGGQSAFGTKAGDLFTKITVGVAAVWIFLCASAVYFLKTKGMPTMTGNDSRSNATATIGGNDEDLESSGTTGSSGTTSSNPAGETAGDGSAEGAAAEITGDEIEGGVLGSAGEEEDEDADTNEAEGGESEAGDDEGSNGGEGQ